MNVNNAILYTIIQQAIVTLLIMLRSNNIKNYYRKIINIKYHNISSHNNDTVMTNIEFNMDDWIFASKTRNYVLNDTLVDWLDCYSKKKPLNINDHHKSKNKNKSKTIGKSNTIGKFIMTKGSLFEKNVIDIIKSKFSYKDFITICPNVENFENNIMDYVELTKKYIYEGIPIIYQPVLMNNHGIMKHSYGIPDLLVRSDFLSRLITYVGEFDDTICAPKLSGSYHYVVVDLKYMTLDLCSDGIHIRDTGNIPAYKCQLCIYNHAIGDIQGYIPSKSFILGRRYKYVKYSKSYMNESCFDRLGHIDYEYKDSIYIDKTVQAISWLHRLRKDGEQWNLYPKPSVNELYPNMCQTSNYQWNKIKEKYAKDIGEITLIWNCSFKNRQIAHKNEIYDIWHHNCNSTNLGINSKKSQLIDKIININQESMFSNPIDRIDITYDRKYKNPWSEKSLLCISVDFETINNLFDDFEKLPNAQCHSYLYMIGVAYKVKNRPIEYKMFIISELSHDAEFQLIRQFCNFLRQITDEYCGIGSKIPILYHWGHIERSFFTNLSNKLMRIVDNDIRPEINNFLTMLEWYDLCEAFKVNKIVINGCFKYGLKEIAHRLYELNLISTYWSYSCPNANSAMLLAYQSYKNASLYGYSIYQCTNMHKIMQYNKTDCLVIHDIINVLQNKINGITHNHTTQEKCI